MAEDVARTTEAAAPAGIRRRASGALVPVALLLAAVFAAVAGWTYAGAAGDRDRAFAETRDEVLAAGREHVARLNSIDAERVDAGLRQWLAATTGPLHRELRRTGDAGAAALKRAGTTADATVTEAALTELDDRAGNARMIAAVRVERRVGGETAVDRKRFEAGLHRTVDGWKLSSLTAITVGAADTSVPADTAGPGSAEDADDAAGAEDADDAAGPEDAKGTAGTADGGDAEDPAEGSAS